MKIEALLRKNIRELKAYSSARDEFANADLVQMDANENPFNTGLNRYPDPYQLNLKSAIATYRGMNPNNLVLGNGSDELIDLLIRAFCEPGKDNAIGLKPSYGMYKVCCDLNDVECREVAMDEDFSFGAKDVLEKCNEHTKLIFLCSPNNPNGALLNRGEIEILLSSFKGIVLIDEAYIDFSDKTSWSNSLNQNGQLVVIQTLSKLFGMASIRLGIAWCSEDMVAIFNRIKPPYNVNGLTQITALETMSNMKPVADMAAYYVKEREFLAKKLSDMELTMKVFPSDANFLLVRFKDANYIYQELLNQGIVVRNRSDQFNCDNCLRITIGTKEENQQLINALNRIKS